MRRHRTNTRHLVRRNRNAQTRPANQDRAVGLARRDLAGSVHGNVRVRRRLVGTHTDAKLVDVAKEWVTGLGKTAITVKDSPGFASSRLGVALALEAMRMVEDGVASAEDIDRAMTLGYRHPVGPLRTTDLVGLDVRLGIAEELAAALGPRFEPPALLRAMVAEGRLGIGGPRVILAKPLTYMNVSGGPVAALARFYGIPLEQIILVHDELDIPFGHVRLKRGGGEGGHNGLRDTTRALGTKDYLRVRVGIGRPPGRMDVADFVLKPFSKAESPELPFLWSDGASAVEALIRHGLTQAQQTVHAPRV